MGGPWRFADGVAASRIQLPPGNWATVLDALCELFPRIPRERWLDRFVRGRILDANGEAIAATSAYRVGTEIHYFREVEREPRVDAVESVLFVDEHLVVADKPHGLPVTPSGEFVTQTLLARLVRRLDNPALVPLHRLDHDTAGLVMFSANPVSRDAYHALFRERRIEKRYEALASPLPGSGFPHVRRSRIAPGEPFFRMQEIVGEPNSESRIDVIERGRTRWRYALEPLTGRKHQLRLHMAALGAPILGDRLYPALREGADAAEPGLQLLGRSLRFTDPLDGQPRCFTSTMALAAIDH